MNLKIKFHGLSQFIKDAESKQNGLTEKENLELASAIMQFHYTLALRTSDIFAVPYSLSKVLIGNTVKRESISKTFARFGLQYRDIAVKLDEFSVRNSKSNAISSAPLRRPDGGVTWKRGTWSRKTEIEVRKGKKEVITKNGHPVFQNKATDKLRARRTENTWNAFPTRGFAGDRENTTTGAFGPSLAAMASGVVNKDASVQNELNKLAETMTNIYLRFYFK